MLIAFNGTGNKDEDNNDFDTNVTKIVEAYTGLTYYQDGVGSGGWFDRFLGGITGWGGKKRVKKAVKYLENKSPSIVIDVVGFSRGSALAIDFCNRIDKLGYQVRCLMLFDTVASFGFAGNNINIGYDLGAPENVEHVFHAMSLDERRVLFPLTRVKGGVEVWFRGFHSDIGGGNGNIGLNAIPLTWMLERGITVGLPFVKGGVLEQKKHCYVDAPCSKPFDLHPNDMRLVKISDIVHESVKVRDDVCEGFPANNPTQIKEFDKDGELK